MNPRRVPNLLLAAYAALALLALLGPGASIAGQRIEPFVLGLPFSFAWYAGWALATFFALVLYHRAVDGGRD